MSSILWKSTALAALVAAGSMSPAQAAGRVGWVWANQPNASGQYTPPSAYSYNSTGGAITVTPIATGAYKVTFAGLHSNTGTDDVQVTAYNTTGFCTAGQWSYYHGQVNANVNCYDAMDNPANTQFDLLYQERTGIFGTGTKGIAFVYANSPTSASYTPDTAYQYNSTGGTNTIIRNSEGMYTVTIPGLASTHSDIQVTAVGLNGRTPAQCHVYSWQPDGNTGTNIQVQCQGDQLFNLAYAEEEPFGLTTPAASPAAWAFANGRSDKNVYDPNAQYQYNGFFTGKLTAQSTGKGEYVVTVPGSPRYNSSIVLVTAVGDGSTYCNVSGWTPIMVDCYAQKGFLIYNTFDVTFQTSN